MGILQSVMQYASTEGDEQVSNGEKPDRNNTLESPHQFHNEKYQTIAVPNLRNSSSLAHTTVNTSSPSFTQKTPQNVSRGEKQREEAIRCTAAAALDAAEGRGDKEIQREEAAVTFNLKLAIKAAEGRGEKENNHEEAAVTINRMLAIAAAALDAAEGRGDKENQREEAAVTINRTLAIAEAVVALEGRWIRHYCSLHRILLVGEGDFSFAACLAAAFGWATNMVATSLDSEAFLVKNYCNALSNIVELSIRKCRVMHEIDATKMANHPILKQMKFDRIVFNFPSAGVFKDISRDSQLRLHRSLVSRFLMNAKEMISENGEIHITHKTDGFNMEWMIESIASSHKLRLIEAVDFDRKEYAGYKNKCGFGGDSSFNCYPSKTYKFMVKEREDEKKVKIKNTTVVSEERWIKHYSSRHRILLVGEGDFSFAACLAAAFGWATNMVATSLDSEAFLVKNYCNALSNIVELRIRKCRVMHEIDATTMANHPILKQMKFDRIVFNFPSAGLFKDISRDSQLRLHRSLVSRFLMSAKEMISGNGEIHITHKTNGFNMEWMIESIASSHKLRLIEAVDFDHEEYAGYNNKRGFGGDKSFNCYPSMTYKFMIKEREAEKKVKIKNIIGVSEERWIKHYSSRHRILLVGEGDFSFAACLARVFGSAYNIVATSLDSEEMLGIKHPTAAANLGLLKQKGCTVIHGVDARTMSEHHLLRRGKFHRIVFNFPHAGFRALEHDSYQISLHQDVVRGFLKNAREMVAKKKGEVHVSHKAAHPYSEWKIEKLGEEVGLVLTEKADFDISDYPGYENKRGDGQRSNDSFPLGTCYTYKMAKII